MKFNIFKRAFSLTELLIVLVVVAVLFSAMIPIMTKRRNSATTASEPVWQFVNSDTKDVFFDKGVPGWTTTAYFGANAVHIGDKSPYSKMSIKAVKGLSGVSNRPESMIQFRYGNGNGILTGLFTMDDNSNILMTGRLKGTTANNFSDLITNGGNERNTVWGPGSFTRIGYASGNTVLGSNAMIGDDTSTKRNQTVAVGFQANRYGKADYSVLLGANSGTSASDRITNTVAIGAGTLSTPSSAASNMGVFAGYYAGSVGSYGPGNTILGSMYYGDSDAEYNTFVGKAYENGNTNARYMTAVGTYACDSFVVSGMQPVKSTCIGYNSAATYGVKGERGSTQDAGWEYDGQEHIFIGGTPMHGHGEIGGRAVLEVHNIDKSNQSDDWRDNSAKPRISPTVVFNSNLVVRGNVYWPRSEDGALVPHSLSAIQHQGTEKGDDRCGKRGAGLFGSTGSTTWRARAYSSGFWGVFVGAVSVIVASVLAITGLPGLLGAMELMTTVSATYALGLFAEQGKGTYSRAKDPQSASVVLIPQVENSIEPCADKNTNYMSNKDGCINLKLSDIRLKENLSENTDAIEKLLMIMPYDYTFKTDLLSRPQVGVIAQDLQTYFPNSVTEGKDGYLSIRWDEMFFATVNSVKSLDKIVQNLSNDSDAIDNDINSVIKEQKAAKSKIADINKRLKKLEK